MADIAPSVAGLQGEHVPVLYTSKTKVVIDFEMFLFPLVQIRTMYSQNQLKTQSVRTVEPGGRCWAPAGMKVLRQGGQSVSYTLPLTRYNIFLFSNSCREQGSANRSQTNMISKGPPRICPEQGSVMRLVCASRQSLLV